MTQPHDAGITRRTLLNYGVKGTVAAGALLLPAACGSSSGGQGLRLFLKGCDAQAGRRHHLVHVFRICQSKGHLWVREDLWRQGQPSLLHECRGDGAEGIGRGQPTTSISTTNSAYDHLLIAAGTVRPYDPSKMKNFDQIIPYFRNAPYDKGSRPYTIPYGYGPAGIAYRKGKVNVTGSWNDLWNNPGAKGKIYVLDQQDETLGMSLIRDGASPNSGDPDAGHRHRPRITCLHSSHPSVASPATSTLSSTAAKRGCLTLGQAPSIRPLPSSRARMIGPSSGRGRAIHGLRHPVRWSTRQQSRDGAPVDAVSALEPENSYANTS